MMTQSPSFLSHRTRRSICPTTITCFNRNNLFCFSVVAVLCLIVFVYSTTNSLSLTSSPGYFYPYSTLPRIEDSPPPPVTDEYQVERVLKEASMDNKTVILTTLNEAWGAPNSILDLFLESFRIGEGTALLLNHLVIIALDQEAYSRCKKLHKHCFALVTEGVDFHREAYFMTTSYLKMMWRRIDFLRSVLDMGYNFVFTVSFCYSVLDLHPIFLAPYKDLVRLAHYKDADIMWFRNPFPRLYLDVDFQIACDHFLGNPDDVNNRPNGGFSYVKSNKRSVEFYKFWYSSRENFTGLHDQDVLNIIKWDPFITSIGLKMKFLDTAYFGGFCEPSKDLNVVCTMHANCCLGRDTKLHDLKIMIQDWKNFTSLSSSQKNSPEISWSVPKNCSIKSLFLLPHSERVPLIDDPA